jgi:hypothetical protein
MEGWLRYWCLSSELHAGGHNTLISVVTYGIKFNITFWTVWTTTVWKNTKQNLTLPKCDSFGFMLRIEDFSPLLSVSVKQLLVAYDVSSGSDIAWRLIR